MARAERLLFAIAIVAIGWYATDRVGASLYQRAQYRELEELRLQHVSAARESDEDRGGARVGNAATHATAARATRETREARDARATRPSRALVGRIDIPRLGVSAIIRHGIDDRTLGRAVGHVPGTAYPGESGNSALAAHRDSYFGPLRDIRAGDRIEVRTPDGDFTYIVRDTRIVPPADVSVLAPTDTRTLTLITCHPFNYIGSAPNRFVVRAEAIDTAGAKP